MSVTNIGDKLNLTLNHNQQRKETSQPLRKRPEEERTAHFTLFKDGHLFKANKNNQRNK